MSPWTSAPTPQSSASTVGVHLKRLVPTDPIEMIWIPEGFAHGFLVLSDTAEVLYKTTDVYYPQGERCVLWNDPALAIAWPLHLLDGLPQVSSKDAIGTLLADAELPDPIATDPYVAYCLTNPNQPLQLACSVIPPTRPNSSGGKYAPRTTALPRHPHRRRV